MKEYNNSNKARRQNETAEQREARLGKMKEYYNSNKKRRKNETSEQREARLGKMKEYKNSNKTRRQNETAEQKEATLAKDRERKRASGKKACSTKQDERKGNSSYSTGDLTSNPVSNGFPNENIDELALARKFHNSVSAGRCTFAPAVTNYGINILSHLQTD